MSRSLHPDQHDIISVLCSAKIRFLVVGGYAFSAHAFIRATAGVNRLNPPVRGRDTR